ncbi:hypothetical protein HUE46_10980 [Flavobacterium columnare]|nr:hypothetical protein [Flavobacterium columnare]QOG56901.1 hypothetical protein HUE29_05670 [Flavobacterium columnare]QOG59626.1 hypothetical protein HUE30_05675 [Flavobacterium columnare]QOG62346.1 hypothetical protein HUE31_05675 [Flavobacterium columnare]QOG65069.1 hypothetical protein HUE32_05680 [Flavobacterium columnare]
MYNPYWVYNQKYSCSIVSYKNTLSRPISVGVKKIRTDEI